MKKSIILLSVLSTIFLAACKKDDPVITDNGSGAIRFEFTADMPAAYHLFANADTSGADEVINTATWSKTFTVAVSKPSGTDTASLFVLPPNSWMNTTNNSNVTLKIFVNDKEAGTKTFNLVWLDRPADYALKIAY